MAENAPLTVHLNDKHVAAGGRIVPFAGYALPIQYPTGIIAEHNWTRTHAGLFDVSHMGPSFLRLVEPTGDIDRDHAAVSALVEPLLSGDVAGLKPGQIRYTLLLNRDGGTLDDLLVARSPHHAGSLYIVVNSGTKEADFRLFEQAAGEVAKLHRADDGVLLALQGPDAAAVLAAILPETADLGFMTYRPFVWEGARLMISRSGYTGEDGFEILAPVEAGVKLWDALTGDERVKPIGLGARDSLRLEAGLPLYGHELDETVSPYEAGLAFAVSKRRREAGDLAGWNRLEREFGGDLGRVRVGLEVQGAPARDGAEIETTEGETVGRVTSGGFSPSLGRAIALAFVPPALSAPGTALNVVVRGRRQPATVVQTPFVPHRYHRKPKS